MQQPSTTQLLLKAVKRILRPLVKLLLAHQITFNDLTKLLKALYVETAEEDFRLNGKPQTDSRISLLTGIHRKEVKNLRQFNMDQDEALSESLTVATTAIPAQLVAAWLGDSAYTDSNGNPKPLTLYRSDEQDDPISFERLVQQLSKGNLRVAPILQECEHLGLVAHSEDNLVELNSAAFIPNEDFSSKAEFFSENMSAHMQTCCHNLLIEKSAQAPLFDRSVSYNNLPAEAVEALQQLLEEDGMALLIEANRKAKAAQEKRRSSNLANRSPHRMTLGLYFYTESQTRDSENGKVKHNHKELDS